MTDGAITRDPVEVFAAYMQCGGDIAKTALLLSFEPEQGVFIRRQRRGLRFPRLRLCPTVQRAMSAA